MTRASAAAVQAFAERGGVEVVHCEKGQRKETAMQRRLKDVNVTEEAKRDFPVRDGGGGIEVGRYSR